MPNLQAWDITEEDKADYLDYVAEGYVRKEAAEKIGTTGSVMKKFWSGNSQWYDEEFARKLEEAEARAKEEKAMEHRVRHAVHDEALNRRNPKLLEKLALIHLPEFEPLRHQNFRIEGTIDHVHQLAQQFTKAQLEEMREARLKELEQEKVKLLPPASAA